MHPPEEVMNCRIYPFSNIDSKPGPHNRSGGLFVLEHLTATRWTASTSAGRAPMKSSWIFSAITKTMPRCTRPSRPISGRINLLCWRLGQKRSFFSAGGSGDVQAGHSRGRHSFLRHGPFRFGNPCWRDRNGNPHLPGFPRLNF